MLQFVNGSSLKLQVGKVLCLYFGSKVLYVFVSHGKIVKSFPQETMIHFKTKITIVLGFDNVMSCYLITKTLLVILLL